MIHILISSIILASADGFVINAPNATKNLQDGENWRIVGGQDENPRNSFPWQALVLGSDGGLCGGTILAEKFVITAAHCIRAPSFTVVAGASNICVRESTTQVSPVSKIHKTSGSIAYNEGKHIHDIVILQLTKPFVFNKFVKKAFLPTADVAAGTNLVLSGWGNQQINGATSCSLKYVTIPKVSMEACRVAFGNIITPAHVCAGEYTGGKSACQGDSGGPLVAIVNRQPILVGVTSFGGSQCGMAKSYSVFANVNSYKNWITSIIKQK